MPAPRSAAEAAGSQPLRTVLSAIYLRPDQERRLAALVVRTSLSRSVFVRAGVDLALRRNLAPQEPQACPGVRRFVPCAAHLASGQKAALALRAKKAGVSRSAIIRAGVDLILADPTLVVSGTAP